LQQQSIKSEPEDSIGEEESNTESQDSKIEVEYVNEDISDQIDPSFKIQFENVFTKFIVKEEQVESEGQQPEDSENQNEEKEGENEDQKISRKQLKKKLRMKMSDLKQQVRRPDLIETWDTTSSDPILLVDMKGYRNSVPIPRHWNAKRKYLQGKRGIEKTSFSTS